MVNLFFKVLVKAKEARKTMKEWNKRLNYSKLKKYIYSHNNNTKINRICVRLRTEIKMGGNLYIDFSTET